MNGHSVPPSSPSDLDLELMQIYDDSKYATDDDVVKFLSMRDNGRISREQYLNSVNPKRKVRIEHERDRIKKLRVKFFANQTKQDLIATHERRRAEWRNEAIENQERNIEELETRRLRYLASEPEPTVESTRQIRVFQNERRVLDAISKWEKDELSTVPLPTTSSPVVENEKLDYGLKACIMHFQKGGGGHTHKHKHPKVIGEFPNQKVPINDLLTKSDDNPLRESCKDGMFRYFHLPTNNMAWIEVSKSVPANFTC